MNFLLAFLLMILVVGFQGVSASNVYIGDVVPGSPAAGRMGSRRPHRRGGGHPVTSANDVGARTREFAGRTLSVVVQRRRARRNHRHAAGRPAAGEGPPASGSASR